jgi:hypothetical protein
MARYFKCDACGKLFNNEDELVSIMVSDHRIENILEYDLCTKCYDRVIVFTNSLKPSAIDTSKCTYDKDGYLNKV